MCLFQQLPMTNVLIEEKKARRSSSIENGGLINRSDRLESSSIPVFTPPTPNESTRISFPPAISTNFHRNFDQISQWILKLEKHVDREEPIATNDLKQIKDQFQKHEVNVRRCCFFFFVDFRFFRILCSN